RACGKRRRSSDRSRQAVRGNANLAAITISNAGRMPKGSWKATGSLSFLHDGLVPKQRDPFAGGAAVILGAAAQFGFAIEKPDEFCLAKPGDHFAFVLEFRKESHRNLTLLSGL